MSNDGQNFDNPVNPSGDTQPQTAIGPAGEVAGAQSRRKFLRTAVISGVAVATVTTSAGVAAAAAQPHTGILKRFGMTNPFASSGPITCGMCFEDTNLNGSIADGSFNVNQNGNNYGTTPGSFYVWFTAHNVPDGDYVITIAPDPGDAPFEYATNVHGNSAFLYQRDAGKADDCPDYSTSNNSQLPGDQVRDADSVPHLFSNPPQSSGPYTVSGGPVDLQVTAHIDWRKDSSIASDTTYTFNGAIYSSTDSQTPLCTASVSVLAKKNF